MATLPPLDHLATLSDDCAVIQHAEASVPDRSTGYCTDDVARAFIVVLLRLRLLPRDVAARALASRYLSFLCDAQLADGRFHNFMSYARSWLDDVGTHDSVGRAIWALGFGTLNAPTAAWRTVCRRRLERALAALEWLHHPRSQAYALLGLTAAAQAAPEPRYLAAIRYLGDALAARYDATADGAWRWFEAVLTYDNARLPEALVRAAATLGDERLRAIGERSLAFYDAIVFEGGLFVPIGNAGWYPRGGTRARYAQQPLEASATVDAHLAAWEVDRSDAHLERARRALAWFYGANSRRESLAHGGGCHDGLDENGVNRNMGAESTLALLGAAYALADRVPVSLRLSRFGA